MGLIRRLRQAVTGEKEVVYEEQTPEQVLTMRDMFDFMNKQSAQNTQLVQSVLQTSLAQSETMKTYIDLFKPRAVPSSTLDEREALKHERVEVRESEWEVANLKALVSDPLPPDPSEW